MAKSKLEKACSEILADEKDVLSIILGGSRARGDNREDSDYDIMLVTKRGRSFDLSEKYKQLLSEKSNIDKYLIGAYLWPLARFKKGFINGNDFVYTILRDGKILASRPKLKNYLETRNLNLPNMLPYGAHQRLKIVKRNNESMECLHVMHKTKEFDSFYLNLLGYNAMHLCWISCMLNNFCPRSKYTALRESKKYFSESEFKDIKKAYHFYAHEDIDRTMKKDDFLRLYKSLSKIEKRIEKSH